MNYVLFILLTLASLNVWGQRLEGYSFGGIWGLGGALKNLVIPNALPLGTLVGAAGHEVYDFSKYSQYKNSQAYCYQSIDFAADANIFGLYFGGEVSKVFTTGKCEMNPQALVGEDLMIFVSFDPGRGSKSLPIGIAFNFGFNMDQYIEQMESRFQRSYLSNRTTGQRLKRLHVHIAKYLAKKNIKAKLTVQEKLFVKLLLFPYLAPSLAQHQIDLLLRPSSSESELLKNISKKGFDFSVKKTLYSFFKKARKDSEFYFCNSDENYSDCEEVYVDFLRFYKILTDSFDDCGSLNIYMGAMSEFSIKLTGKLKFEIGFGYTRTEFNRAYDSRFPTSVQAVGQFLSNNFVKKSNACQQLPQKVGTNFAHFLNFLK